MRPGDTIRVLSVEISGSTRKRACELGNEATQTRQTLKVAYPQDPAAGLAEEFLQHRGRSVPRPANVVAPRKQPSSLVRRGHENLTRAAD